MAGIFHNQWCGPAWRQERLDNGRKMSHWMGPVIWIPKICIAGAVYGRVQFLPKARKSPTPTLTYTHTLTLLMWTPPGTSLCSQPKTFEDSPWPSHPLWKANVMPASGTVVSPWGVDCQSWAGGERSVRTRGSHTLWDLIKAGGRGASLLRPPSSY